jgi:hypothetical protein
MNDPHGLIQAQEHAQRMQHGKHQHEVQMKLLDQHFQRERDALQMAHFKRLAALWQGQDDDAAEYEAVLRRNGVLPPEPAVPADEIGANAAHMAHGGMTGRSSSRVRRALRIARGSMPPQDFTKRRDGGRVY